METTTDSQTTEGPEAAQGAAVQEKATPQESAEKETTHPQTRKERVGVVVSDKMDKTIVVAIQRRQQHPMYDKYMRRTSRLMAHDEHDDANEGDTVRLMGTRPLSKRKRWRLAEIVERAK